MNELELFAGAGGGILGSMLLGHRCVCAVEYDAYARSVLLARQNDGTFPPFPVWDDVRTFDGKPWRGVVDVVSGGFPCQDISVAGSGAGLDGERSGLWREMARIVGEVRPRFVFIENSPMLLVRGLDRVLADLAALGFDARWGVVSAADTGALHRRDRMWILGVQGRAYTEADAQHPDADCFGSHRAEINQQGSLELQDQQDGFSGSLGEVLAHADCMRQLQPARHELNKRNGTGFGCDGFRRWPTEPGLGRVANGVAHRTHRLKALGNGQVPRVRATAWSLLYGN